MTQKYALILFAAIALVAGTLIMTGGTSGYSTTTTGILGAVASVAILFFLYRGIKSDPDAFSWAHINKSLSTLGVLAIILIIVIGFVVMMLQQ